MPPNQPSDAHNPGYLKLIPPWHVGPPREIARTRIFTLLERRCTSATSPGRSGDFVFLRCPEWVNIIALTDRNEVVMVEQFRYGTATVTLEVPAGMVEAGESPDAACIRELREETGYSGAAVRMLGKMAANPALNENHVHIGLIQNARLAGAVQPDEHEEIGVRLVPLGEIPVLIRSGIIVHSFVIAAFHLLALAGA